jgi:hypothetical protein
VGLNAVKYLTLLARPAASFTGIVAIGICELHPPRIFIHAALREVVPPGGPPP